MAKKNLHNAYSKLIDVTDYLYEATYNDLDYEYARQWFEDNTTELGGCSTIAKGSLFAKSHDWLYNENAEFVVHTPDTLGVASNVALTDSFVKSRAYSELYKIVPFLITDGINKHGLAVSVAVLPKDKGINNNIMPNQDVMDTINKRMVTRYILDNFDTATHAVNYLTEHVKITAHESGYDCHYMIKDSTDTYILEFYNDSYNITYDENYMTNFYIGDVDFNSDHSVYTPESQDDTHSATITNHISTYGSGLERWNIIAELYNSIQNANNMRVLLNNLAYTQMYDTAPIVSNPYWYSELVGESDGLTVDSTTDDFASAKYNAGQAYLNRSRDGETWHTTHASIYDLENLNLNIKAQETNATYNFNLKEDKMAYVYKNENFHAENEGDEQVKVVELRGLSTDVKPTVITTPSGNEKELSVGSVFYEVDTRKVALFDGTQWNGGTPPVRKAHKKGRK